jgi:NAD(P)-dependent dehydrogenase (short-subunit alcohol dehydrogenase family)
MATATPGSGRVIVVTGASRGIGARTAQRAAERGYRVCVNYQSNRARADEVVRGIESAGGRAIAVQADVGDADAVARMFDTVDRELGRVTALVNNAGVNDIAQGRVDEVAIDEVRRLFNTNVMSQFLCSREAIRRMSTKHGGQGGAIVNLSSTLAHTAAAGRFIAYGATKGAIEAFSYSLAQEVAAEGIRVNCCRPGPSDTDMIPPGRIAQIGAQLPMGRISTPDEVANTILWLLSDEASYVSGTTLAVTGAR